ncbi:universal stress protein [Rhabdaerophilum calidifontis]|uniref:universal stress protein n=1 Tax=Rhabdaerophilum calidifontis TaxID=2604328 RepID=UPI00140CE887|nr:universal stress protein [Rhabdaerophilum calidifontis]
MSEPIHRLTDIACLVRVAETTPMAAIRQTIALAAAARAIAHVTLGVQTFTPPYTPFWTGIADTIAADVNQKAAAIAEDLAEEIRKQAAGAGVEADVDIVRGAFAGVAEHAARAARAADLVVVDQPHGALDTSEVLFEEALFRSGRPVLVAAPDVAPVTAPTRIVVAWDGSCHAARATADALFAFPSIREVDLVTVSGEKSLANILPPAAFGAHLGRKGLAVTVSDVARRDLSVAAALDHYARNSGAHLLVMGGFGHTRLMEFLLGGVTVELTGSARLPLLMSY